MLRLYDTLTRQVTDLRPRRSGEVSLYVCGPTVYDVPHLGHARTAVTYDVLNRYLTWRGFDVNLVSNITDIDDKIIARAAEEGISEEEVSKRYEKVYLDEMGALSVGNPRVRPRATEYVTEMKTFISELLDRGAAYLIKDLGVYFEVSRYPEYGRLAHRSVADLREGAGARVAVEERKRDPLDFALWKAAKPNEPSWESPWMAGRPGWHIECVAMSLGLLGEGFDIHGGGSDLVFPHHENERAEAEAAGRRFAGLWMHSAMLNVDGEKMAKSAGNFRTLGDALAAHGPRALRLAFLQSHYRSTMEVDGSVLAGAAAGVGRIDAFTRRMRVLDEGDRGISGFAEEMRAAFTEAMNADLGTPAGVAVVFDAVRRGNTCLDEDRPEEAKEAFAVVQELSRTLGLEAKADNGNSLSSGVSAHEINRLVAERKMARASREFAKADAIRERLRSLGVDLEDTPSGETVWRPAR